MAKRQHRVFEMYDFLDEAVRDLTRNAVDRVTDVVDWEFWDFNLLVASHTTIITHVEFKKNVACGDEATSELHKDFAVLASRLVADSKVLLDFTDLKSFSTASIDTLVSFSKDLKHRGSRVVLCCLEPAVQEAFFSICRPCSH